jgi:hypothetical protein
MNKEFIPYEQALALKELGFDEQCITFYPVDLTVPLYGVYATLGLNGKYSLLKDGYKNSTVNILWNKRYKRDYANVTAPTYSAAFRWFRETYQFVGTILGDGLNGELKGYYYSITEDGWLNFYESVDSSKWYDTYEEAELACLKKLIEIVKEKPKQR